MSKSMSHTTQKSMALWSYGNRRGTGLSLQAAHVRRYPFIAKAYNLIGILMPIRSLTPVDSRQLLPVG